MHNGVDRIFGTGTWIQRSDPRQDYVKPARRFPEAVLSVPDRSRTGLGNTEPRNHSVLSCVSDQGMSGDILQV